jgi:hypothetical protein
MIELPQDEFLRPILSNLQTITGLVEARVATLPFGEEVHQGEDGLPVITKWPGAMTDTLEYCREQGLDVTPEEAERQLERLRDKTIKDARMSIMGHLAVVGMYKTMLEGGVLLSEEATNDPRLHVPYRQAIWRRAGYDAPEDSFHVFLGTVTVDHGTFCPRSRNIVAGKYTEGVYNTIEICYLGDRVVQAGYSINRPAHPAKSQLGILSETDFASLVTVIAGRFRDEEVLDQALGRVLKNYHGTPREAEVAELLAQIREDALTARELNRLGLEPSMGPPDTEQLEEFRTMLTAIPPRG